MADRTLADDEAALDAHADALIGAVAAVASTWIERLVASRSPELAGTDATGAAAAAGAATIVTELRELLALDIAEQRSGPLEVLRRGTRFATDVLRTGSVAPVARDEFARRNFPDDLYDLVPATFADVDASLHEPGLVWGAAKAHVHLRRRREGWTRPGR